MSTATPAPQTPRLISGILCDVELDKNGFVDVSIADEPGQELLVEWIVRGAISEEEAIRTAESVIHVRRHGLMVMHDAEGRIIPYTLGGES